MASKPETVKYIRRYDPSMSRRTRKPQVAADCTLDRDDELQKPQAVADCILYQYDEPQKDSNCVHSSPVSPLNQEEALSLSSTDQADELQTDSDGTHRASLKELMHDGQEKYPSVEVNHDAHGVEKDASLEINQGDKGNYEEKKATVPEEKNRLAVVPKKGDGGKSGGMVSRCVKMLNHLIKAKRDSKKKAMVRLQKP